MRVQAFIDAANLFYGGEKSLGWKIDYQKLLQYLRKKYHVDIAWYFGGVETYNFVYDYSLESVPIAELEKHLEYIIKTQATTLNEAELLLIGRHLQRVRFFHILRSFGYHLMLKPVKHYRQDDGTPKRKANCDVDMAFMMMREFSHIDRLVVLSGDGDFLPVLKYFQQKKKEVIILGRGMNTAREIKQFAGSNFRDFVRLERELKYEQK